MPGCGHIYFNVFEEICVSYIKREFSSAGSEHLPYKQRVGGSNPSTPTKASVSEAFLILVCRNPELHCVSISIPANLNDPQNPT